MNTLENLYYGNINPTDKCYKQDSEYANFLKIVSDNQEKIIEFLSTQPNSEKEQHLFSQMLNAQSEIDNFAQYDRFIEGFRLGAEIMLETFVVPQQSVIRDIY